jgi:hypothetical protein
MRARSFFYVCAGVLRFRDEIQDQIACILSQPQRT